MTNSFKALSALLSYPTQELKEAVGDIREILYGEALAPRWAIDQVKKLLNEIDTLDLYELQERYVFLFDRTRSLSLHLFEHVHGESRDRGQAMVDLRALYEQAGLDPDMRELPDYLPMFLEYLSTRPVEEARGLLAEPLTVIAALKERLARRKTPYAAVLRVLEAIAGGAPSPKELDALRKAPDDDPNNFEALDALWEDSPVTFGPESDIGAAARNTGEARS
ncbi:MAG: nitrate reductase molybdenum cofactor assembly chaperone [Alphaproteobacteria bacterium RIFCSPHIGHO2_12_FULL_63_12]|nr:MAG: nitrate reductase molybdenum cofactor assembly chaperone [Alphaproteobacteria bacterium RIFCSPHIGHO2_12_FULL_63_12]